MIEEVLSAHFGYCRLFCVFSVPYLFNALFLIFLVRKLDLEELGFSWITVFAPLCLADVWTAMLRRSHAANCLGSLLTKIGIYFYVSGHVPKHIGLVPLCVPLWLSVMYSAYCRCILRARTTFSIFIRTFTLVVLQGLQPLLVCVQVDDKSSDWVTVLTPTWMLLVVCFCGALFLVYCAPVIRLHSLESLQMEATILIFLCCLYLLTVSLCGFVFVFW